MSRGSAAVRAGAAGRSCELEVGCAIDVGTLSVRSMDGVYGEMGVAVRTMHATSSGSKLGDTVIFLHGIRQPSHLNIVHENPGVQARMHRRVKRCRRR